MDHRAKILQFCGGCPANHDSNPYNENDDTVLDMTVIFFITTVILVNSLMVH